MLITAKDFENNPLRPVFVEPIAEFCFFCAQKLTIPCVMWHGGGGDEIYMHPSCTKKLIQGLTLDTEHYKNEFQRNK
jgi:hypothetical protein